MTNMPATRPNCANFSSGPCAKRPGWTPEALKDAPLGRSHRAKIGKAKLKLAIDLTREVLQVPADYRIGIVPASDTGAVEMALWSLLGARGVDMLAWESFGEGWITDIVKQLKLKDARVLKAGYGDCRTWPPSNFDNPRRRLHLERHHLRRARAQRRLDPADRKGLTICDATSAAFAQRLPWDKLDVVTFSWQKAWAARRPWHAHSRPRAVERLESYSRPGRCRRFSA
jgi:phosphoserine aminotransferase